MLRCAFCKTELGYVHGHAACVRSGCPMFGVNQAECCSGETAENGPLTAEVVGSGASVLPTSMGRREFVAALAAPIMTSSGAAAAPAAKEPRTLRVNGDGKFPNSALPVLVHASALAVAEGLASRFEELFESNGWTGSWRNGLYRVHHYHSTAHEVLGVYRGEVRVCLGGDNGTRITLRAGDVAVLPAGVAHKNEQQSSDFAVVGAYPTGTSADLKYGEPGERPRADAAIKALRVPEADPVQGKGGALVRLWRS
jgi:uncharacterized protein YjlB